MAIEPLLERHLGKKCVYVDDLRIVDQSVQRHRPGADLKLLSRRPDLLVRPEFIKVVVLRCDVFGRQVAV